MTMKIPSDQDISDWISNHSKLSEGVQPAFERVIKNFIDEVKHQKPVDKFFFSASFNDDKGRVMHCSFTCEIKTIDISTLLDDAKEIVQERFKGASNINILSFSKL